MEAEIQSCSLKVDKVFEKHPWRSLFFSKVAGCSPAT